MNCNEYQCFNFLRLLLIQGVVVEGKVTIRQNTFPFSLSLFIHISAFSPLHSETDRTASLSWFWPPTLLNCFIPTEASFRNVTTMLSFMYTEEVGRFTKHDSSILKNLYIKLLTWFWFYKYNIQAFFLLLITVTKCDLIKMSPQLTDRFSCFYAQVTVLICGWEKLKCQYIEQTWVKWTPPLSQMVFYNSPLTLQ